MTQHFRPAACIGAVLSALACHAGPAYSAPNWPSHPLKLILPSAPGGSSDPTARLLADEMSKRLGQPIVVMNRPGAGGNVGMAEAANAPADGYTLLLSWTGPLATNMALYKNLTFDPQCDFTPIAKVGCVPNIVAVNKDLPVKTLKGFIEYSKKKPEGLTYGSTGTGSSWHIAGAMIKKETAANLTHVPYTSPGVAINDLLSGRLDSMLPLVIMMVPFVESGQVKGLAVMSKTRSSVLPNVPSTTELGMPGLISDTCFALLVPKGVQASIADKLNQVSNDVLKDPAVKQQLEARGITVEGGTARKLADYIKDETIRQAGIVKASSAKAE